MAAHDRIRLTGQLRGGLRLRAEPFLCLEGRSLPINFAKPAGCLAWLVNPSHIISRRQLLGSGALAAGALAFGPSFWKGALAAEGLRVGPGPYGPLNPPDCNGLMLPDGFSSRVVARGKEVVENTTYPWHVFPDGQATFATEEGFVLVSNSESLPPDGGSSAIRFKSDGTIVDAYRILSGTQRNCAGGRTPRGKWLSCEEAETGMVWECDPFTTSQGTARPAMGMFKHEAVAVDPVGKRLYMTEDEEDGAFYRFTPTSYPDGGDPDLRSGTLEVAVSSGGRDSGFVTWKPVLSPAAVPVPTREQVPEATRFDGGEGIWYDSGIVYFSTKGDNKIRSYEISSSTLEVLYDAAKADNLLTGLDNLTVSSSGDLYICEDGGDFDIGIVTPDLEVARFLKLTGPDTTAGGVQDSELAGVIFDPSGTRMYFSSQRGRGLGDAPLGRTFEVTGPFRLAGGAKGPTGKASICAPPSAESAGSNGGGGTSGGAGGSSSGGSEGSSDPGSVGALVERDVRPPGLTTRAARSILLSVFVRKGLRVRVRVDEPGTVAVALRTNELLRTAGPRGSAPNPRTVTLALGRARFTSAGEKVVTLRLRSSARRRMRGRRSVGARLTVQAKDVFGNAKIATRGVRIRP